MQISRISCNISNNKTWRTSNNGKDGSENGWAMGAPSDSNKSTIGTHCKTVPLSLGDVLRVECLCKGYTEYWGFV